MHELSASLFPSNVEKFSLNESATVPLNTWDATHALKRQ